jgi:hypothetical protein
VTIGPEVSELPPEGSRILPMINYLSVSGGFQSQPQEKMTQSNNAARPTF